MPARIYERLAHSLGVSLVDAKHDGFLHRIGFAHVLNDFFGDELCARIDDHMSVIIGSAVYTVFHRITAPVAYHVTWTPLYIFVENITNDFIRSEETIFNTLFERVGINGSAKIFKIIRVISSLGSRRQTNVRCTCVVVENRAPQCVVSGDASVALVHDDEIKEVWRELLELFCFFATHQPLIKCDVHLVRRINFEAVDLRYGIAEVPEVAVLCLISECCTIDEEQYALFLLRLPEPPDDLERRVGLAGPCRHDEHDAVLALCNCFYHAIYRIDLIVARTTTGPILKILLQKNVTLLFVQILSVLISLKEGGRAWKCIYSNFSLNISFCLQSIMLKETRAVRTEDKWDVECFGIDKRLLHTITDRVIRIFGLYERNREIVFVIENIVRSLLLSARNSLAAHIDASSGEAHLLSDLRLNIPPRCDERRSDVLRTDIALRKAVVGHTFTLTGRRARRRGALTC